ncbi:MAG: ligase-associated DNA damage response DEXH box helicase [Verrucomicrobiales bacterium]
MKLDEWFDGRGWEPFPFQRETWAAYLDGRSGLVHAPTGIGKTLSVWGGPLLEADPGAAGQAPLTVLWLTPLRALAADTAAALRAPVEGMGLPWAVEIRTGDTSSSARAKQRKRLPTVLVTTPESLSLLLTYPEMQGRMETLKCVVVDEWHEMLGNKRGVQLQLCLARLRRWLPALRVWGLSATIGNLQEAMQVLLGDAAPSGVIVEGQQEKIIEVETLLPGEMENFPWSGHLGIRLLEEVLHRIEGARTTLFFTNTRSQTEIWFQALVEARPEWEGSLAMHHGSLEREIRDSVEQRLAAGEVKCVVCTSSLDLGVDFSPVEQVMQVGSPKGVARLVQRAGRSGHQPGAVSKVLGVPTNALELIEFAAAREAIGARRIEGREPVRLALDVLVQHLVTVAIGGGFTPDEMRAEVMATDAFAGLGDLEWSWCLDFVCHGGQALRAYPDFKKVVVGEDGVFRVLDRRMAQTHRMNIGTITSEVAVSVRMANGKSLGTVDEGFISGMKIGAHFVFAGRRLELVRFRDLVATVKPVSRAKKGQVAIWTGSKFPLSTELADAFAAKMREGGGGAEALPEMVAVEPVLAIQRAWSHIPSASQLLVEETETREGHHAFVYPFAGRLVHEGLATLFAFRLSQQRPRSIQLAFNDYGFELRCAESFGLDAEGWKELCDTRTLLPDLLECMNIHELARRQFREIARVAGLVVGGYPGRPKSNRSLQASSGLIYEVFTKYDADNLLIAQAQREILERQLELGRLQSTLDELQGRELVQVVTARLTPLAFPLWAETLGAEELSSEKFGDRLRRMLRELEAAARRPDDLANRPERVG